MNRRLLIVLLAAAGCTNLNPDPKLPVTPGDHVIPVECHRIVVFSPGGKARRFVGVLEHQQLLYENSSRTRDYYLILDPSGRTIGDITDRGEFSRRDGMGREPVGEYTIQMDGLRTFFGLARDEQMILEMIDPYE